MYFTFLYKVCKAYSISHYESNRHFKLDLYSEISTEVQPTGTCVLSKPEYVVKSVQSQHILFFLEQAGINTLISLEQTSISILTFKSNIFIFHFKQGLNFYGLCYIAHDNKAQKILKIKINMKYSH